MPRNPELVKAESRARSASARNKVCTVSNPSPLPLSTTFFIATGSQEHTGKVFLAPYWKETTDRLTEEYGENYGIVYDTCDECDFRGFPIEDLPMLVEDLGQVHVLPVSKY